jgi:hypothetical protein
MVQRAAGWGDVAEKASKIALDVYKTKAEDQARDADNKHAIALQEVQNMYEKLKGPDADDAPVAAEAAEMGIYTELRDTLKNPLAIKEFDRRREQRRVNLTIQASNYANNENARYHDKLLEADLKNTVGALVDSSGLTELFEQNLPEYERALSTIAREKFGADPSRPEDDERNLLARVFVRETNSETMKQIALTQVANGNKPLALQYLSSAQRNGMLDAADVKKIHQDIAYYEQEEIRKAIVMLSNKADMGIDVTQEPMFKKLSPSGKVSVLHPYDSEPDAATEARELVQEQGNASLLQMSAEQVQEFRSKLKRSDYNELWDAWKGESGRRKANANIPVPAFFMSQAQKRIHAKQYIGGGAEYPYSQLNEGEKKREDGFLLAANQAYKDAYRKSGGPPDPKEYDAIMAPLLVEFVNGKVLGIFPRRKKLSFEIERDSANQPGGVAKSKTTTSITLSDVKASGQYSEILRSLGVKTKADIARLNITERVVVDAYKRKNQNAGK